MPVSLSLCRIWGPSCWRQERVSQVIQRIYPPRVSPVYPTESTGGAVARGVGIWRRDLRHFESIRSCGEVSRAIDGRWGQRLAPINHRHVDVTSGEQRREQRRGGLGRRPQGLRLDPPLELFVQTLDRVRCSRASPLTWRQPCEGEQAVAGFLEAVGDRAMAQPPLA